MRASTTTTVKAAAACLGISEPTVRNWIRDGIIAAERGPQLERPRLRVLADDTGWPLSPDGVRVPAQTTAPPLSLEGLAGRLDIVEQRLETTRPLETAEGFRDAALQLQQAMERQRRALDLQMQAFQELNAATAEQAQVIAGLLIGDPSASL